MKKVIQVAAMVMIAIGVGVAVVWAQSSPHLFWGTVNASGTSSTIFIEAITPGFWNNEVIMYVQPTEGGFATDPGDPRAEIIVRRTGSDGTGHAWLKSSSGAKVMVETNGNVTFQAGS